MVEKEIKFKADFSDFKKGAVLVEVLNKHANAFQMTLGKIIQANNEFERQNKAINESLKKKDELLKKAHKEGATPLREAFIKIGQSANIFRTMLANPFAVATKGAMALFNVLMMIGKATWIGIITLGIALLKRIWDTNMGGIQSSFFKVMGTVLQQVGMVTAAFYRFAEKIGPIFKPIFDGLGSLLIPLIKGIGDLFIGFLQGETAVGIFTSIADVLKMIVGLFSSLIKDGKGMNFIKDIFGAVLTIIKVIIDVVKNLLGGFTALSKSGESGIGALFKSLMSVVMALFKVWSISMEISKKIGTFQLMMFIFKAIGFVINLIALGLSTVVDLIMAIVNAILKAVEWFIKLLSLVKKKDSTKEAEDEKKKSEAVKQTATGREQEARAINNQRSTTVNNNQQVNIHSSGPITDKNAPHIADIASSSIKMQMGQM